MWGGEFFVQSLAPKLSGTTMVEIPQRASHLSAPMRFLEELTYNQRIHHSGDPVLQYGVSNVIAKHIGNLIQPDKAKPEQKIDPAVALMMALSRASVAPLVQQSSFTPFFL
jgi:phage terminase large subunit-like protein